MNLKEALKALADGKKVRPINWPENFYVCLNNNDQIFYTQDNEIYDGTFHYIHWSLFEEPKKPIESLNKALDKFMKSSGNFNLDTIDIINKIVEYLNEKENERT